MNTRLANTVKNVNKKNLPNKEKNFIMTMNHKIIKHVLEKLRVVHNVQLMVSLAMNVNKNKASIFTLKMENAKEVV